MKRIYEPSTWAGLGGIFQAVKFFFPAHSMVLDGLTAIAGGVAVMLPEKGGAPRVD